ncbi:MAG: hypothetical protein QF659_05915, partial [Dehalococcoidia bacterium]|nr:hypothetical protein [Dehalococcoidia bacterium]
MIDLDVLRDCYTTTPSKIIMLVVDGLGGLPHPDTGLSELETAEIPNLDALARDFAQHKAGWYSGFHETLAPTIDERAALQGRYLALLGSRIPPTV